MSRARTLVVTLGQLRAPQTTWPNFKEKVLGQLAADLAVCVGADDHLDLTNPFYRHARHRWLAPVQSSCARMFDRIQALLEARADWRRLCDLPGSWLARVANEPRPPGAAFPYLLRWFMLDNIRAAGLHHVYDRFVITRPDLYYLCPHPPLDCLDVDGLWIPDGEDYGGIMDKHLVVSAPQLFHACNLLDELLADPDGMRAGMEGRSNWNIEQAVHLHLERNGLLAKVQRFPYVMCLVRAADDPTELGTSRDVPELGITIRYPSEYDEALRYRERLATSDKWRRYFSSRADESSRPARLFTTHGTVVYVDEASGEVRHGPLARSPRNVVLRWRGGRGEMAYRPADGGVESAIVRDTATAGLRRVEGQGMELTRLAFESVHIAKGFALDQTLMTNNLIGLRANGNFLCAQVDGSVRLDRLHCHLWEHFRILPDE